MELLREFQVHFQSQMTSKSKMPLKSSMILIFLKPVNEQNKRY